MLKTEHQVIETGANSLTVEWTISAETFLRGIEANFSGTETFYFDPQGKIAVGYAEWDPAALAEQLMKQYRTLLEDLPMSERLDATTSRGPRLS